MREDRARRRMRATMPGGLIRRELEARGWSRHYLSTRLGWSEQVVGGVIEGEEPITPKMAEELAGFFGTSARLWVTMEANYRRRKEGADEPDMPSLPIEWPTSDSLGND